MISITRSIIRRNLNVELSMLFANKTIEDIILKEEFDSYSLEKPNFNVYYVLDNAPAGWEMGEGRINSELMSQKLPEPSDRTIVYVCGPPMMQLDMRKKLIEIGHSKERVLIP